MTAPKNAQSPKGRKKKTPAKSKAKAPAKVSQKREKTETNPKGAGRHTKFTRELGQRICVHIEDDGVRPAVAAALEGINPVTLTRWETLGRADDAPPALSEFVDNLSRARLVGEATLHRRAAGGDMPGTSFGPGKAALELLSRTNKHYAPKVQFAVQQELQSFLDCAKQVLPGEWFDKLIGGLAALEEERTEN